MTQYRIGLLTHPVGRPGEPGPEVVVTVADDKEAAIFDAVRHVNAMGRVSVETIDVEEIAEPEIEPKLGGIPSSEEFFALASMVRMYADYSPALLRLFARLTRTDPRETGVLSERIESALRGQLWVTPKPRDSYPLSPMELTNVLRASVESSLLSMAKQGAYDHPHLAVDINTVARIADEIARRAAQQLLLEMEAP